ncbi:MAG: sigma-70 family RNA polymerase sigma factor [Bacteroidales bacterium]|nr:sigma-70 family RNA polymerase sigma factor [Bacteroidales bacterium]
MDKQIYISYIKELRQMVEAKASSIAEVDEVEDIAQEVLLKLWEHVDLLEDDKVKLFAYASATAKHIALNSVRSKRRHPILRLFRWNNSEEDDREEEPIVQVETNITPLHVVEDQEMDELFWKALKKLPFNWQRILIMRNVEDRSFAEIAEILATTESSVRGVLSKARKKMLVEINQM